jgi:preprotein translocase subunit SecG
LISLIQITIVSVYTLIIVKLLKDEKRKSHRLSGLTAEEIRKNVQMMLSPEEALKKFWKRCSKRMALLFLISPLLASYYLILVISASIDEGASNRWAVAFLVSWILDLFTLQILKAVLNAIILAFFIRRENKTKRKSKWAYLIFAPQIIKKMRATVKPFVRRTTL